MRQTHIQNINTKSPASPFAYRADNVNCPSDENAHS